mmetsp:Transcript_60598/g.174847  ORF Transcript_60598/g.174847 Transcript_60598/m.174847 type:complete len:255 (-) Transcript_60598:596-1360(-)
MCQGCLLLVLHAQVDSSSARGSGSVPVAGSYFLTIRHTLLWLTRILIVHGHHNPECVDAILPLPAAAFPGVRLQTTQTVLLARISLGCGYQPIVVGTDNGGTRIANRGILCCSVPTSVDFGLGVIGDAPDLAKPSLLEADSTHAVLIEADAVEVVIARTCNRLLVLDCLGIFLVLGGDMPGPELGDHCCFAVSECKSIRVLSALTSLLILQVQDCCHGFLAMLGLDEGHRSHVGFQSSNAVAVVGLRWGAWRFE